MDQADLIRVPDGRVPEGASLLELVALSAHAHARLLANPAARVLVVFCGAGTAVLGLADAYPGLRIDGFDVDDGAIAAARREAAHAGLDDRVRFEMRDPRDVIATADYDLILVAGHDAVGQRHMMLLDGSGRPG